MNKKVLTLCAGFLLAGGMLSSVSADQLSTATAGKYYKIWRAATYQNATDGWQDGTVAGTKYYLSLQGETAGIVNKVTDYWKIEKNEEGQYVLTNLLGEQLVVADTKAFGFDEETVKVGDNTYTQLSISKGTYVALDPDDEHPNDFWTLVARTDAQLSSTEEGDKRQAQAFDAESTTLEEVDGFNANILADGGTYRIIYADPNSTDPDNNAAYAGNTMLKAAYDKSRDVWSFTKNSDNTPFELGGEVDFKLVKVWNNNYEYDAILMLKSGNGYVKYNGTNFEIVSSIADATILAFQATNDKVPVSVDVLNYYEKDGFSVEINGYDTKNEPTIDLAGNPFTGHLTPMVLVSENGKSVFKKAADQTNVDVIKEYYLKDEAGNYIVATKYDVEGEVSWQALYNFKTVSEADLLHNIARARNNQLDVDQIYFGLFRASVDEAALDEDKTALDEITWLEVNIDPYDMGYADGYYYAELGRADIKDVPTLVATFGNFTLKQIHISLQPGNLVDWKEFLQAKFYTVEKVEKDGTNAKLTANYIGIRWTNGYGNELEGQFALTVNEEKTKYVFTNRETLNSVWSDITINGLYTTDKEYTYKFDGDTYVIKPVAEVSDADGYKRFSDSELNRQYHVAFSSEVFDSQAYLSEEHADAEDPTAHVISLNPEKENALVFNVKKYNAARNLNDENKDTHVYTYHPTDSIYVISKLGFYNTKKKDQDFKYDTLKVVTYSFVNQFTEPLMYGIIEGVDEGVNDACYYSDVYANDADKKKYESVAKAHEAAQKFAVRYDGNSETKYNLRPVNLCRAAFPETDYVSGDKSDADLYQVFDVCYKDNELAHNDWNKVYAGDVTLGILDNVGLYDREENDLFVIEETESEVYRRLVNNVDTISIYRNNNEKALLYEKTMKINDTTSVNFLGLENIADFTEMAPAMIADTAYVRYDTYKPQYMLVVDPTIHPAGKWCDVCESDDCEHAVPTPAWTEGRFLVNLKDSAAAWADAHKHQLGNPYLNEENLPKLGFVQGIHRNDSLIIASDNKKIFVGDNNDNIAKFQFRYKDITEGSFVIETEGGYLKWMNGVVVVISDMTLADVYNVNEDESRQPTANEEISANAAVSVVATDGAVIVKGAEGKNVVVSTILGKVVANEVLNSDNETIAAPAGIVVVSVDGEQMSLIVLVILSKSIGYNSYNSCAKR